MTPIININTKLNLSNHRLRIGVNVLLLLFTLITLPLKAQESPSDKADSAAAQATAKAGKFKSFFTDSIPQYTEEFGGFLKGIIDQQNKHDYLDQVPQKKIAEKRITKKPQKYTNWGNHFTKPYLSEVDWTGIELPAFNKNRLELKSDREIYAFHGFWDGNSYELYDFNAINRIGFVGYSLDPTTGSSPQIQAWHKTNLHKRAVQYKVDIDLVVTSTAIKNTHAILVNSNKWETYTDSILFHLQKENGAGIVIDFYGVDQIHSSLFVEFCKFIKFRMGEISPRYELGVVLPESDPENYYQSYQISDIVDRFIISTGDINNYEGILCSPGSPLLSKKSTALSVDNSLMQYLNRDVPASKIILAYQLSAKQYAMDNAKARTNQAEFFSYVPFAKYDEDYCIRFRTHQDDQSLAEYISFSGGDKWYITWGENLSSISIKADYVNTKDLKGVGFYDISGACSKNSKFWPLLYKKFLQYDTDVPMEIQEEYAQVPEIANIDSLLSVNQAIIMSAINLADNPFLPEKPDEIQLAKAMNYGVQYKEIIRIIGMFFTILLILGILAFTIAMFDERVRTMVFYESGYLILGPLLLIFLTIALRLMGVILNSGMEFILGALAGLGIHYLFKNYMQKRTKSHENTP